MDTILSLRITLYMAHLPFCTISSTSIAQPQCIEETDKFCSIAAQLKIS